MSMWESVKNAAVAAAEIAQTTAQQAAIATQQAYADLKSFPTEATCITCGLENPIPPETWNWECQKSNEEDGSICTTSNAYEAQSCRVCGAGKPKELPPFQMTCGGCGTQNPLSTTKAMLHLKNAPRATSEFVGAHVKMAKDSIKELRAAPEEFHCAHCRTLLAVPKVPWTCPKCGTRNTAEDDHCSSCAQRWLRQKVKCGVCRKTTPVPSTNLEEYVRSNVAETKEKTKKFYYSVTKKTFVTCPRCKTSVKVVGTKGEGKLEAADQKEGDAAVAAGDEAKDQEGKAESPSQEGENVPKAEVPNTMDCPECDAVLNVPQLLQKQAEEKAAQQEKQRQKELERQQKKQQQQQQQAGEAGQPLLQAQEGERIPESPLNEEGEIGQ